MAVLESPSTVHLLLDQMFMHIKCSSKSESDKSNSSREVNSENSSASSKEDMQSSSNENDAGGGTYIFTLTLYDWH